MREPQAISMGLPRPGKGLIAVLAAILCVWIMFAVALNFGGLPMRAFLLFAGNADAIRHGEVWRLFTAGLLHMPRGQGSVQHVLYALIGLYFLTPTLEERWGARRTVLFLAGSSAFGFFAQFLAEELLPGKLGSSISQEYWFGAFGAVEAVAVAWALSNRGREVRLFMVLPISSTGLLAFVIGVSVLRVVGNDSPLEGLITPFGGMLAGYLFGAGSPTPARRLLLRVRYLWLSQRAARARASRPKLKVIAGRGGSEPPDSGPHDRKRRPPSDKRFLN